MDNKVEFLRRVIFLRLNYTSVLTETAELYKMAIQKFGAKASFDTVDLGHQIGTLEKIAEQIGE